MKSARIDRDPAPMPHVSEPVASQRARYPLAVADVFDVESMHLGNAMRPGELRRCVFDSPDGLRLIVSREAIPGRGTYLHVSASLDDESGLYRDVKAGRLAIGLFLALARDRFEAISGDAGPLDFGGLSVWGVPHWFRKEGGGTC